MTRNRSRRGPGRPRLGAAARSVVVPIRLTKKQYKMIAAHVAKENAGARDSKPATVSSWVRDVIADAIPHGSRDLHKESSVQ